MRVEMVLKDMGAKENGSKAWVFLKYSLAHPKTKLRRRHLWIRGSCWGKGIEFELVTKV